MLRHLRFFLGQFLFWMLIFAYARMVFWVFYAAELSHQQVGLWELLASLFHGWKLDISTCCYIMALPFLIQSIQMFFRRNWGVKIIFGYHILFLLVFFLIQSGELGIYYDWASKLNYKALLYLRNPSEMIRSTQTWRVIVLSLLCLVHILGASFLLKRYFLPRQPLAPAPWYLSLLFFLLTPGLLFLGLRGGWAEIPIQQSESYYSNKPILNDIAVNSAWNLGHSSLNSHGLLENNPFTVMPHEDALHIVQQLQGVKKDSTTGILIPERPNIVVIILESWSADIIGSLGGLQEAAPFFNEISQEGILFTETYSSGKRSQQGLSNIFAGYPALPQIVLTDFPEKSRKLPTLTQSLKKAGYTTSFYFGGQLIYGNLRSFLIFNNFDRLIEGEHFTERNLHRGKLGVHDQDVLARQLRDLDQEPQPFFSSLFTLSSHSPFDQPLQNALQLDLPQLDYINSVYYTDQCLKNYFEEAKKQSWYKNTLFVLVADHSRKTHIPWDYFSLGHVRVPMLFYGEALREEWRGKAVDRLATQVDLPATLLHQLQLDASLFPWSRNLFNPYTDNFVWVEELDGPGFKRPEGAMVYNTYEKYFRHKDFKNSSDSARITREGQAYLQVLFQEFIDL